jgi:hypothetical protein
MNKRTKRALQVGGGVALLSLLIVGIASASDDKKDDGNDKDPCGPDDMRNPIYAAARARVINSGLTGSELALALSRIPLCVPRVCAEGYYRDEATGACVKSGPTDPKFDPWKPGTDDCPEGFIFSKLLQKCVPTDCGAGFHVDENGDCVPDPTDPVDPVDPGIDYIVRPVPVPGNFYQVKKGDIFFGKKIAKSGADALSICYMALRRAAYEAARIHGDLDEQSAWGYVNANASRLAHEIHALRPYLDIIGCGWWNDEVNASWRYKQGKATPAPTGRAISLNPIAAPNLARMRGGQPPARNVRLGKPSEKGDGSPSIADGSWRNYPLVWIPEIDLALLWQGLEAGGSLRDYITAEGLTWDDGSSRAVPPPWVQALGIFDATGTLQQGTVMGCGPSQKAVG